MEAGPRFNRNMTPNQYRKSRCGDKMILPLSYLHNEISYTCKTTSLYSFRAQDVELTLTGFVFINNWKTIQLLSIASLMQNTNQGTFTKALLDNVLLQDWNTLFSLMSSVGVGMYRLQLNHFQMKLGIRNAEPIFQHGYCENYSVCIMFSV